MNENPNKNYWFIFKDDEIFLINQAGKYFLPQFTGSQDNSHSLGYINNIPCLCSTTEAIPESCTAVPIRQAYDYLGIEKFKIACKALQILKWDKLHQFCSQCGTKLEPKLDELAKICKNCGKITFPKFSPSIIVGIKKDHEILLARPPHFPENKFALVSGFIEPGETAEAAVEREVMEEVGLKIKNINYFATQSWPFPDTFMIGFTADYAAGEIKINEKEIVEAKWFNKNNLPDLPLPASISRQIIDYCLIKD